MSKFHSLKTVVDGISFDSRKEANRYAELKLLERAGQLHNLRLQVPYVLVEKSKYGQAIRYIADFVYEMGGETIVEDVKGYKTDI